MLLLWGGGRKANAQQIARFKSFESKPKSGRFVRMVSKFVFFLTFSWPSSCQVRIDFLRTLITFRPPEKAILHYLHKTSSKRVFLFHYDSQATEIYHPRTMTL